MNPAISLNEIAALINQIDAILDDADGDIFSAYVDEDKQNVQLNKDAFLSEFVDFEITVDENEESIWPYRLYHKIDGVTFFTLTNAAEIAELETSIPDQFEYISKKLQEEVA